MGGGGGWWGLSAGTWTDRGSCGGNVECDVHGGLTRSPSPCQLSLIHSSRRQNSLGEIEVVDMCVRVC